jgi:ABC-type transport system substrate-binding protein
MVNGMYIQFTLDPAVAAGNVKWHDGNTLDANDIIFSWKYIWKNGLTNFLTFYEDLIDVYSPAANSVTAYWNVTSQWLLYEAAATAALFAPQVWGKIDTDWDGANYLDNTDLEGDTSIRAWQPEMYDYGATLGAHPASSEFPWLTQVVGTGPFVFYKQYLYLDVDLFAFDVRSQNGVADPALHYWKTTTWISNSKTQWFYEIGDVDMSGNINVTDIARIGQKYGQTGTPGWILEDVVKEGVINVYDLWTVGRNYGKVREY